MSTVDQIRQGLSRAWDSLAEGWRELRDRAGGALTLFQPKSSREADDSSGGRIARLASRWGVLAAEVSDDEDAVQVTLELPGLEPDDIEIEVIDDVLVVRGEKKVARDEKRGHYHVMERAYGQFERAIRLPARVEHGRSKARYRRGVLTITLPKTGESKIRRITVESA